MINENTEGYINADKTVASGNSHEQSVEEFLFTDFLDMINPLQHIPILNIAYRAITGDQIKPISEIIGGGVFGGAIGAASGVINALVREETGKDIAGNIISLVRQDTSTPEQKPQKYNASEHKAYNDLPVALLNFAERPLPLSSDLYKSYYQTKSDEKIV